jgi:NAD(P)-dependent dehydrogenase (short-subunit alcohol dehydrogenase family)
MELGLKGRVAVVTGGSKGIGKAIAKGLAAEGVNLVLLARGKEQLDNAAEEIKSQSKVRVLAVPTDITSTPSVKAAADAAATEFGTVHIVVNNAGGPIRRMDRQINWPDTDWMDDVNLKTMGMLRTIQAFLPHIDRKGAGRIINISGASASLVWNPALTHGINNSAMNHVTGYLAQDLAADQITVNAVVPGLVGTEAREVWAENMGKQQNKTKAEFLAEYCRKMGILSGRWASMEEVADTVLFLASDRARYFTGAKIAIDGGISLNAR